EAIIAGMVVALAASPLLLQRMNARMLGVAACIAGSLAFGGFAVVDLAGPAPWLRETSAFGCFTVGAGALALLAPAAQALVALAPAPAMRATLTSLWIGSSPGGFLVAPQLVKVFLPVLGIGFYFLGFATLPLLLLVLLGLLGFALPAVREVTGARSALPAHLLLAFVAAVIAFEVWTSAGSVGGYGTAVALVLLAAFLVTAWTLGRAVRRYPFPPAVTGATGVLVLALFVLQFPTTGFFDTAFLTQRQFAQGFIADRATLAAAAQILGIFAAGILAHRRPAAQPALLLGFAVIAVAGLAAIAVYPWVTQPTYLLWTPVVQGFGTAGVTVLICLAIVRDAAHYPLLAALPSIAIMLGTEFGLELLQLVFALTAAAGVGVNGSYGAIFAAQVLFALAVPVLLSAAHRRGKLKRKTPGPGFPPAGR
ncbi:MAG: hypothetical protein ABIO63_03620, partial [Casimicrobiaceae bacterium]